MSRGSTKFVAGIVLGATTGFTAGYFTATPTARSASQAAMSGLSISARFLGQATEKVVRGLGSVLESTYTRIWGREAYLENEIEELRVQITRLEQRIK